MASNTIQVTIRVDGESAVATVGDFTKKLGGIGTTAAKGAIAGVGAVTAAVAGLGIAGTKTFVGLQNQMNEVFTLLPGISDEAMSQMTQQVNDFASEFGTLPEEVIPALYQSISAGVPADNVFSFLETAQKAAIGGVTELETAVDGISSVVNAYGSDVISAGEASDLMFTAVKLGKTNFDQLSRSLFNVIPTTSALGVGFGDVTAGLAALTAQGTPTTVATTQMRQMFVELSKATGKTSETFQEIAGKTFKEFIAEGNNTQDALLLMEQAADELGVGINDLFGSVEAGNAALGLTGKGTETFARNLEEMANATGATEAAFDQMDTGLGRVFDKIKARGSVFLNDIGSRLAPGVERLADGIIYVFDMLSGDVLKVFDVIGPIFDNIVNKVFDLMGAFTEAGAVGLMEALGLGPEAQALFAKISSDIQSLVQTATTGLTPILQQLADGILPALNTGLAFVNEHWEAFRAAIVAVVAVLAGAAVFATVAGLIATLTNPITLVIAAVGLLSAAWTENWFGIRDILTNAWLQMQPHLQTLWEWLQTNIPVALQYLSDFWNNVLYPALENVWNYVQSTVIPLVTELFNWLMTSIPDALQVLSDFWNTVLLPAIQAVWSFVQTNLIPLFEALVNLLDAQLGLTLTVLQGLWENVLLPAMKAVGGYVSATLEPVFDALSSVLSGALSSALDKAKGLFDKLKSAASSLSEMIGKVVSKINDMADKLRNISIPDWLTPGSPTPFELGLRGIANALSLVRQNSNVFDALNGTNIMTPSSVLSSANGNSYRNSNTVYNFNQTINTRATTPTVVQDFQTARALVG